MTNQVALIPINEVERMAMAVAKSGLFGVKEPNQALALMLIAQAEGLHPAIAARDYNIIQGRPALKADAMLARFQSAGGKVEWMTLTDERVVGKFTHAQGGTVEIDWDMARAKKAGLGGKDNWTKWPRQMLRARVISEGIRTVFPGCIAGFYAPEEVMDFAPEKDITPATPATNAPAQPAKPTPVPEAVKAAAAKMKESANTAAKPAKPAANVIEGTATTVTDSITGDPSEGDLSVINPPAKATEAELKPVIDAFDSIGYNREQLEVEYGKKLDDWTTDDIDEARKVYRLKSAERKEMLAQIAAEREAKAGSPPVEVI